MPPLEPPPYPTLYLWQVLDDDDRWGLIAALIPGLDVAGPLITRSRDVAENEFASLAEAHRRATGKQVRLSRYDHSGTLQVLP